MNGKRNSLSNQLKKLNRRTAKRVVTPPDIHSKLDVGDWRITQDSDGSLILYNFETGAKVQLASKEQTMG